MFHVSPLHGRNALGIDVLCPDGPRHQRQQTFEAPHGEEGADSHDRFTNPLGDRDARHTFPVINIDIHCVKEWQKETKLP